MSYQTEFYFCQAPDDGRWLGPYTTMGEARSKGGQVPQPILRQTFSYNDEGVMIDEQRTVIDPELAHTDATGE
jgi:hypothetical protein